MTRCWPKAASSPRSPRTSPSRCPLTWDGLKVCRALADEGTKVNVTLCFSPAQALLAAKAGATFISPFVGRLDDIGHDGMQPDRRHRRDLPPSTPPPCTPRSWSPPSRTVNHVIEAARLGAHVVTLPPKVLRELA